VTSPDLSTAPPSSSSVSPAVTRRSVAQGWSLLIARFGRYAMLPVLLGLVIVAFAENGNFFQWSSISGLLAQNAAIGIVGVGVTFALIGGGIDVSVGAIYALGAVMFAKVAVHHSLTLAFVAAVASGVAAGAINALLVTRLRFNSFVVTLGTGSVFSGLVLLISGTNATYPSNPAFGNLGTGGIGAVPYLVIFLIAAVVIGELVLHRTTFGKSLFAVGGNLEASRLAGLRVDGIRAVTYLLSGGCAALAGILVASQSGEAVGTLGGNVVIEALTVVVIGGTSLTGGEGSMWRTAVGVLILAVIGNLFTILAIDDADQSLITGGILVAALALDAATRAARG
jgi:ribose transport system permease protein